MSKRTLLLILILGLCICFFCSTNRNSNSPKVESNKNEVQITPTSKISQTQPQRATLAPTLAPTATTKPTAIPTTIPITIVEVITKNQQPSTKYACNCAKTCPNLSCEEAQYQLNVCGCAKRDADNDGMACDAQCQ